MLFTTELKYIHMEMSAHHGTAGDKWGVREYGDNANRKDGHDEKNNFKDKTFVWPSSA